MAYISAVEADAVRERLAKEFPGFEFLVTRKKYIHDYHNMLEVVVASGPVDFSEMQARLGERHKTILEKAPDEFVISFMGNDPDKEEFGEHAVLFKQMLDAVKKAPADVPDSRGEWDRHDILADGGPTFYLMLMLGEYDRPYVQTVS